VTAAIKSVSIMGRPCTPPYFVLALATPDGDLSQIYLHPIAAAPNYLIPVESAAERSYAQFLVGRGAAVIKPVKMEDTLNLIKQLGLGVKENETWPYRPDFIIPWRLKGCMRLQVRELRGFSIGTIPIYDHVMRAKPAAYSKLVGGQLDYKEIDGTNPPPCEETLRPEHWPHLRWRMPSRSSLISGSQLLPPPKTTGFVPLSCPMFPDVSFLGEPHKDRPKIA
jgi:hypothetical protein